MKEDYFSQLDDNDEPFCEQQYTHGSCYISLFKFKSFDQFKAHQKLPQILEFTQLWHCRGCFVFGNGTQRCTDKGAQQIAVDSVRRKLSEVWELITDKAHCIIFSFLGSGGNCRCTA